jgi:transposase InsO family protein
MRRPDGYWEDFKHVETELRLIVTELGRMPTAAELKARRQSSLSCAIIQHGGFVAVAARLGIVGSGQQFHGVGKDFNKIEGILLPICCELGRMPRIDELKARGLKWLLSAIARYHGGLIAVGRKLNERGMLVKMGRREYPAGYWHDLTCVENELRRIVAELGRMPTAKELRDRHLCAMTDAIRETHGGFPNVAKRLGLSVRKHPHGFYKNWENFQAVLLPVCEELGRMPTAKELKRRGLSGVCTVINECHGGFAVVRERLGYALVTDADFARHADVLAQIVPQLGTLPTTLWSDMKTRWTRRDLDTAIAEYSETQSLGRFRSLLSQD